jgi:hypothetical protein
MPEIAGARMHDAALRAELAALETTDEVLRPAAARAIEVVGGALERRGLGRPSVHVVDFSAASADLLASRYATAGAKALGRHSMVVVNARFLLEIEATLRAFQQAGSIPGTPQLRSDDAMYGMIRRVREDLEPALRRLRRDDARRARSDPAADAAPGQLAMALAFFLAHEAGHLRDGLDARSFSSFVRPDAPIEVRVENAVVKLCGHVGDMASAGFELPGGEQVLDPGSAIRRRERELRADVDETELVNHAAWFAEEVAADAFAGELLSDHVAELARRDPALAEAERHRIVRGVFGAAVYGWFRDLLTFREKVLVDEESRRAGGFSVAFAKDRRLYVHAAELFGDVHRFTLLRASLLTEELLAPTGAFGDGPCDMTDELADSIWRFGFLGVLMDTAVKLAQMGCAAGWMLQLDEERGHEQPFLMHFESLESAVERLVELTSRKP